jgi:hypothetical protein
MMGGARGTITEVASSSSRKQMSRYDGLHQTFLSQLSRFHCIRA